MKLLVANNSGAGPAEVSASLAPISSRRSRTSACWWLICKPIRRQHAVTGEVSGGQRSDLHHLPMFVSFARTLRDNMAPRPLDQPMGVGGQPAISDPRWSAGTTMGLRVRSDYCAKYSQYDLTAR